MLLRAALSSSVLWAMLAACSPPAAPATRPTPAASTTPATTPVASSTPAATPTPTAPPATPAITKLPEPTPPPPRPSTAGWTSFEDGDLVGFKDAQGKVVLSPRFAVAQEFTAGGMACGADNSGWLCIDGNGTELLRPFVFDNGPDEFSEGLARFVEADKFGFFDAAGDKKIPARFSFALPFAGERAAFCDGCTKQCEAGGEHCSMSGGKWGQIDKSGAVVVPATFASAEAIAAGGK